MEHKKQRKPHGLTEERAEELADALEEELRRIRQGEYSPLAKHIHQAKTPSPLDPHLRAMILRQRGRNHGLVEEIIEKVSPESKERLFRVLQNLEEGAHSEKRKRKRGQWWP